MKKLLPIALKRAIKGESNPITPIPPDLIHCEQSNTFYLRLLILLHLSINKVGYS